MTLVSLVVWGHSDQKEPRATLAHKETRALSALLAHRVSVV